MATAPQRLVSLVARQDVQWTSLPSKTGYYRVARSFTSRHSPTIGGGLVEMADCEVVWALNYDEIITVLEGEVTIRLDGADLIDHPGDQFLIRYGTEIAYVARERALFAWAVYPTQRQSLRWPAAT